MSSAFHLKLNKSALNLNLNLTTTSANTSMLIQRENNFKHNYLPSKPKSHSKPFMTVSPTPPLNSNLHKPQHSLMSVASISKSSSNIFNQPLHTINYCTSTNPISKAYASFFHSRKSRSNTKTSFIPPIVASSNTAHIKQQIKYLQMQTSPNVSFSHLPSSKKLRSVGLNLGGKLMTETKDNGVQKEIHTYARKILLNECKPLTKNKPVVKIRKENVNKVYYDKISPVNKNINFLVGKHGGPGNTRNCGNYGRKYKVLKQKSIEDKEVEKFLNEFNNVGCAHSSNAAVSYVGASNSNASVLHMHSNTKYTKDTTNNQLKRNKSFTHTKPVITMTNDKAKRMFLSSNFDKPITTLNNF